MILWQPAQKTVSNERINNKTKKINLIFMSIFPNKDILLI